jgi:hypothetical protein
MYRLIDVIPRAVNIYSTSNAWYNDELCVCVGNANTKVQIYNAQRLATI